MAMIVGNAGGVERRMLRIAHTVVIVMVVMAVIVGMVMTFDVSLAATAYAAHGDLLRCPLRHLLHGLRVSSGHRPNACVQFRNSSTQGGHTSMGTSMRQVKLRNSPRTASAFAGQSAPPALDCLERNSVHPV